MSTKANSLDLARITLAVLAIVALLAASLLILKPFLPAIAWATTIVLACWPLMLSLQSRLGGRRGLAVAVMMLVLMVVLVVPVYLAISTIVSSTDQISGWVASLSGRPLPQPPEWLSAFPVLGPKVAEAWRHQTEGGSAALATRLQPYITQALRALVANAGAFGALVVQILFTVLISALLFLNGEAAGLAVQRFFRRLAGERGREMVILAGKAIRSVALGVVVTALLQTVLAGIGLAIAGIPYAGLFTAVALVLSIAQVGPGPILIPAIIWLYATSHQGMGTFLLIWSIIPLTVDNVIRPVLIRKGVDLPMWLIISGVIGGLLAFGVIGLFVGPVVLAVAYTLMESWVADLDAGPAATE